MNKFKCSNCNYSSDKKEHVQRHINNKIPCGEGILEIKTNNIEINCDYCKKTFTTKPNLKKHMGVCKILANNELLKKDEKIKELEKKIENIEKSKSVVINIQNNYIINGYSNTSFKHLTDRHYQSALNKMIYSVPTLIKDVHFNSKIPQNHNIYISNIRGKYALVYDGKKWEAKDQNETIDKLIMDQEYAIEEWLGEDKFPEEMIKFNNYLDKKDSNDKVNGQTALDVIKEEVKLLLYNNRNIIKLD